MLTLLVYVSLEGREEHTEYDSMAYLGENSNNQSKAPNDIFPFRGAMSSSN